MAVEVCQVIWGNWHFVLLSKCNPTRDNWQAILIFLHADGGDARGRGGAEGGPDPGHGARPGYGARCCVADLALRPPPPPPPPASSFAASPARVSRFSSASMPPAGAAPRDRRSDSARPRPVSGRAARVRRRLRRHAQCGVRALRRWGARLPDRLAAHLGGAERPRLRCQPRRDARRDRQRRCRARRAMLRGALHW